MFDPLLDKMQAAIVDKTHPRHAEIVDFVSQHIMMAHSDHNAKAVEDACSLLLAQELSCDVLRKVNATLVADEPDRVRAARLGTYRDEPFAYPETGRKVTTEPGNVELQVRDVLGWAKADILDIYELFLELLRIHPFIDGNGRTMRLVALSEMLKSAQTPFMFRSHDDLIEFRQAFGAYLVDGRSTSAKAFAMATLEHTRPMAHLTLQGLLF